MNKSYMKQVAIDHRRWVAQGFDHRCPIRRLENKYIRNARNLKTDAILSFAILGKCHVRVLPRKSDASFSCDRGRKDVYHALILVGYPIEGELFVYTGVSHVSSH